jgi:hypothetical protein
MKKGCRKIWKNNDLNFGQWVQGIMAMMLVSVIVFGVVTVLMIDIGNAQESIAKSTQIFEETRAEPSLVACWHFNENTGTTVYDTSGNDNNGTIYGAAWATGVNGSALSFDGVDDYIEISDDPTLRLTTSATIEAWVKVDGTTADHQIIVAKWYPGGNLAGSYVLEFQPDGLTPQFVLRTSGRLDAVSNVKITFGSWTHIAGTYDGTTSKIYVNGKLTGSREVNGTITVGNQLVCIGAHSPVEPADRNWFNGIIDEVCIYNRALSAEEIKEHYEEHTLDITLSSSDITFSKLNPIENETIQVYAVIHNDGEVSGTGIVKFYDGDPNNGGIQIDGIQSVTVKAGDVSVAKVNWTATNGDHVIYVTVENVATGEIATASNTISVGVGVQPVLVLTTGAMNLFRFESGEERTVSVEVTCYQTSVSNVHLRVVDDQNLTIDSTITPLQTMSPGQTLKFYLRIKVPELTNDTKTLEFDILIQAVGDGGHYSNVESMDIVVSESAVSFFSPLVIITIAACTAGGIGGAAAYFLRKP